MRPPRYQRQMRRPPRQKQRQPELKLRRHPPHGPRCHPRPHPPATVVTSDGATGVEPIGENACASCDASAIISPTPAAATKTVFLMGYDLSLPVAARRQKSAFCRETQLIGAAAGILRPHRIDRLPPRTTASHLEGTSGRNPIHRGVQF
jgi:hypothetical protein